MKKNVLLSIIAITLLMAFFTKCKEEDPIETKGNISGTVTEDGSNKAIAAAVITVSGVSQTYKTGDDGKYEITKLEEGNYVITVSKAGYITDKKDLTVKATQTTKGDFSLEKDVPKLKVNPDELDFGLTTEQMPFSIINENNKTEMEWQITIPENTEWLSVSKQSGKLSKGEESIVVSVDRSKMPDAKTYEANLVVKSTNGGGNATVKINVSKVVPELKVEPKKIDFGIEKEQIPFTIKNNNPTLPMDWVIEKPEDVNWLSLSATEGKDLTDNSEVIIISVDRNKLTEEKKYTTILTVKSTNGGGNALINIEIEKRNPRLSVSPETVDLGNNLSEKNIMLINSANVGTIKYNATSNENWITLTNSSGTLNKGDTLTLKITVSRIGLSEGQYSGTVEITSDANNITVNVNMEVIEEQAPIVNNLQYTNITHNSVSVSAALTNIGTSHVTAHGFCWSTINLNPTIDDIKMDLGAINTTQDFNRVISNLSPNTKYYIRAYATNNNGTSYSQTATITTFNNLTLETNELVLAVNKQATVAVETGNGSYKARSDNTDIAATSVDDSNITISGIDEGSTTITVTDKQTNQDATISVTITSSGGGSYPAADKIFVEGGTFNMGSPYGIGNDNERPQHQVNINDFYISKYEVTNSQYADFLNAKGNQQEGGETWLNINDVNCQIEHINGKFQAKTGKKDHPVMFVTWYGAKAYCKWVGGELPTEAEWEYAARGGSKSQGYTYSGSNNIGYVAWFSNNSDEQSHPVGKKAHNELGIYDMSGNVTEWCNDWYGHTYYSNSPSDNPKGPASGSTNVIRGSSFVNEAFRCTVAYRWGETPITNNAYIGIRVVFH